MKKTLLIFGAPLMDDQRPHPGTAPTVLKLAVDEAEMAFPGWLRFTISDTGMPDWDIPATVCWQQIPEGGSAEVQSRITDEDVARRVEGMGIEPGLGGAA